jgi:aryl-alcohol dehydrogenase-like predicted oxidoreductase
MTRSRDLTLTRQRFLQLAGASAAALATAPVSALAQSAPVYDPAVSAKPVQTKPIPSSGEPLPIVGMGTWAVLDAPVRDPKFSIHVEAVRTLLNGGGKVIDTAPTYGPAETALGEIFKRSGLRDKAFIATKISLQGNNKEKEGIAQVAESMKDLGTNHFELLQVHNIRDWKVQLRTIRRLKDEGKVKYVGITSTYKEDYGEFEHIVRTEKLDFAQIDYALDNREVEARIFPLCIDRGVTVLTATPFSSGRLFARTRGKQLPEWAKQELDCASWANYFLKFLLGHAAVGVVIPGTGRPEHAVDNLYAGRGRIPNEAQRRRMVADWEKLAG